MGFRFEREGEESGVINKVGAKSTSNSEPEAENPIEGTHPQKSAPAPHVLATACYMY